MDRDRQYVLGTLLLVLVILSGIVLGAVLRTVVFAITVAYVLYPLRRWLRRRGFSDRVASAIATTTAFGAVALIFAPLVVMLYQRRNQFIDLLRSVPDSISITLAGTELTVDADPLIESAISTLQNVAVDFAVAAPSVVLQFGLFVLVLYGLLYRPRAIRAAMLGVVPDQYHDILSRLHRQTRKTLFSLYVLQASTAFATFIIAAVIFWSFGYTAPLSLAVIAGILQFIPILGPSLLVAAVAISDAAIGNPVRAIAILVIGLLFISFVPDAVIRTKLAGKTGEIAPTLYFVGFVGGILTIGALGIIIGPLVVALLVEVVDLLSESSDTEQTTLSQIDDGQSTANDGETVDSG